MNRAFVEMNRCVSGLWRWLAAVLAGSLAFLAPGPAGAQEEPQETQPTDPQIEIPVAPAAPPADETTVEFNVARQPRPITGAPRVAVMGEVKLPAGSTAEQVVAVMGSAIIEGDVRGDVVIILGRATINGTVRGELVSVLSTVDLGPKAYIRGEAVSVGGQLKRDPAARLRHEPVEVALGGLPDGVRKSLGVLWRPLPLGIAWPWMIAGAFFALHLLILLVLPKAIQQSHEMLVERPLRCLVVGILSLILFLPVLAFVGWTIVAIPLLLCALAAVTVIGKVTVCRTLGGQLGGLLGLSGLTKPLPGFLVGTVLVHALYMVPVLGWLVWFLLTPLGTGAVIAAALSVFRREGQGSRSPALPLPAWTPPPAYVPAPAGTAAYTSSMMSSAASGPAPMAGAAVGGAALALASELPPLIGSSAIVGLTSAEIASLPRVGFWPRLAATALDTLPIIILSNILSWPDFIEPYSFQVFLLLFLGYHIGMWVWKGTTLGGSILSLKCVRLDGSPVDFQIAAVRAIGAFLSFLPCGLGFIWASINPERQSWHDMIAGTTIVKTPRPVALL